MEFCGLGVWFRGLADSEASSEPTSGFGWSASDVLGVHAPVVKARAW